MFIFQYKLHPNKINHNISQSNMRFSKSERTLHQSNFNPPCNVYQQLTKPENKVLTGSLAPPSSAMLLLNKNTFGYSSRFPNQHHKIAMEDVGPGSYNIDKIKKQLVLEEKDKGKILKGQFIKSGGNPSIPYSYYGQNPDEEQQQYIKLLEMNTNLINSHSKTSKAAPIYTFSKSKKNPSYITSSATQQQKKNEMQEQFDQGRTIQQQETDRKNKASILWREKIKEANHKRLQIIQMISPDYVPSLELIQIMKKRRNKQKPGPADYHPEGIPQQYVIKKKKDDDEETQNQNDEEEECQYYQIGKINEKGQSFPNQKRFGEYDKNNWNEVGPGQYEVHQTQNKYQSQKYSFAKSERKAFDPKVQGEFRFYIDHENGSHIGINKGKPEKIIKLPYKSSLCQNSETGQHMTTKTRSDSCCPFGSSAVRFPEKSNDDCLQLTLQEEQSIKKKNKLNKMIRTRTILHKKQGTHKGNKDEGLLGISTMASTID